MRNPNMSRDHIKYSIAHSLYFHRQHHINSVYNSMNMNFIALLEQYRTDCKVIFNSVNPCKLFVSFCKSKPIGL